MGFFKSLLKVAKVAAPIALSVFAPGIGTAIGTALGATTAAGAAALGGAVIGAGTGALGGGGIRDAALGAVTGGVGGYISGSGGLTNAAQNLGLGSVGAIGPTVTGVPLDNSTGLVSLLNKIPSGSILNGISGGGTNSLQTINGLASLYSGIAGSNAAEKAAKMQQQGINAGVQAQKDALTQIRGDLQPFREAGVSTLPALTSLVNSPQAQLNFIQDNPFYKFLAEDAKNKLLSNQAAKGKVGSGGTAEALQNALLLLGNDLINVNITQKQNLASMGQNAASQTGTATQNTAGSLSDLYSNYGTAGSAGVVGASNAKMGAINNYLNTATNLYGLSQGIKV